MHYQYLKGTITAPQHLVCRAVPSLHINHMQMSIIEVFICRRLHMNTSMILICIWLICRLGTALHTKCCGAVYSANQKEYLAMVHATKQLCYYLFGRPFKLQTDHAPLQLLSTQEYGRSSLSLITCITKIRFPH